MVKFSEEWDKLKRENRIVGMPFTTIRGYDWRKDKYYQSIVGKVKPVVLKDEEIGKAKLSFIEFSWVLDLPIDFLRRDIREDVEYEDVKALMRGFYGMDNPFCIILHFIWEEVY